MKLESNSTPRDVLTPEALTMLQHIADCGSFAAASRLVGMVPSALTYRVRQIEDALDVLLFDRSSRQARLTPAGEELIREGARLLDEIDAVANRVKRVATGWEPQLTVAVDSIVNLNVVMELCEAFFSMDPPTRIRLRSETLSGTLEALSLGYADLALGVVSDVMSNQGLQSKPLGTQSFVFAVAPHHPLAHAPEPLSDDVIVGHRIVAAADTVQRGSGMSVGLLRGQNVFTVTTLEAKLQAQLRGLGCGFLPQAMARPYLETGRLVARRVERKVHQINTSYAWRRTAPSAQGQALSWWLEQLDKPATRAALMSMNPNTPGVD
ncbi:LysR family transcriptional regulator [Orrella marina]|uniref:LysR family transcriptional regulator n=1 Tax=Orrella marina TaxID=2163011 RepID=A0A2R4XI62_9BURK|nr:LysR family transcriptional regulator [Orrella marina]AWB33481.1 LysR family transcriptional regulator [Orrella marina]